MNGVYGYAPQITHDEYDRLPPFLPGAVDLETPLQRIAHLETFLQAPLSNDERVELSYLILMEKCIMYCRAHNITDELTRLMNHPYSSLAVAYKQLGTISYEHYQLSECDDLNIERLDELLHRIEQTVDLCQSRPIAPNAKNRFLAAAKTLFNRIETDRNCPLFHVTRRFIEKSLNTYFQLYPSYTTWQESLYLMIKIQIRTDRYKEAYQAQHLRLHRQHYHGISYVFLDESLVQFWNELPPNCQLDLLFHMHIQDRFFNIKTFRLTTTSQNC